MLHARGAIRTLGPWVILGVLAMTTLHPPERAEPTPSRPHGEPTAVAVLDALAAAPLGLAVFDRALRFVHVNASMADANGLPVAAHLGKTLRDLFPAHLETVALVEGRIQAVLETRRPTTFTVAASVDGVRREWLASYFPIVGASGSVDGACGIVIDVTADRAREAAEARARMEAERTARHLGHLQDVTAALAAVEDPAQVAEVVVDRARRHAGAVAAMFHVLRQGTLELAAASGEFDLPTRVFSVPIAGDAPLSAAVRRAEPLWLEDRAAIAARFPAAGSHGDGAGAVAVLPLAAYGRGFGALSFAFAEPEAFDADRRAFLLSLATQAAQALDRANTHAAQRAAHEAADRATERLSRLLEITAALSASRTPEEIARTITERAHAVVGASVSAVYALEPGGTHLRLLATRGADSRARLFERVALDAPLPACRAARGEPVWLETPADVHAAFPALAAIPAARERAALVSLPLRVEGRVVGAFGFTFDAPRRFDEPERAFLLAVAEQSAIALDRARLLEAEREARAAAERAREEADRARALLDAIVENAPIGIGFLDGELRYQRVNPRLAEMNGLPVKAHLGKRARDILPALPHELIEATWRRVVETGEPVVDVEVAGETPGAPGRRIWLESWYPVRADGRIVGVGALVRDVTRERDAEEFQRHVMGVVGHDLRNPLSAIMVATKLLGRADLPRGPAGLVGRIGTSAARIDEIVSTLLDYARVRAGTRVPVTRRRADLSEIACAVAEECRLAHPGSRIECGGEGDCTGEWDPDRVAQLVTNLVSNALQHGPEGTPVLVRWRSTPREVVLEVANGGPPIPADVIPLLFQPFRRGEGARHGGLGLGLFIAHAIAAAHRGRIDVRSSEREGTVFSVRLPRWPEQASRS
jgi:PAS domain S-box-containing protein